MYIYIHTHSYTIHKQLRPFGLPYTHTHCSRPSISHHPIKLAQRIALNTPQPGLSALARPLRPSSASPSELLRSGLSGPAHPPLLLYFAPDPPLRPTPPLRPGSLHSAPATPLRSSRLRSRHVILGPIPPLRHSPIDILLRGFDIAGFAVDAAVTDASAEAIQLVKARNRLTSDC